MFLIVRVDAQHTISVLDCAETKQIAQGKLTEEARKLIVDKCGKEHLNVAFCENKDSISSFCDGFFLVLDGDTIHVYKKEQRITPGYFTTAVDPVVNDEGTFRLLEATHLTCREKIEGEYVCSRCDQCETRYVCAPTNVNEQAQSVFCNVMSELARTTSVRP